MIASLQRLAGDLVREAVKRGADEAQVKASHRVASRIAYEKNDFGVSATNAHSGLELKVHRDRRQGSASTNETTPAAVADAVDRALTLAEFSIEDEHLVLPGPQEAVELSGRFDPALADLSPAALHELAAEFVAAAKREPRMRIDAGQVEVATVHEAITNSRGLSASDRTTKLSWVLMGMGKDGDQVTSFDYLAGASWVWENAAERSQETARELVRKVMTMFGARKGESYRGAVLLSPAVLGTLLFRTIEYQVGGQQIMDGKSRWAEAIGEAVASDRLTLRDEPFDLSLSGAKPYDAEGVSVKPWDIIAGGVLRTHIDSTYTAKRRGTKSTGHAGGLHGIVVSPGDRTKEDLLKMPERLVAVERFSGNVDPISGDFSGVAKGSHLFRNGEHLHPLTETMIVGNVFELLKNVVAVSDRAEPWCNAYRAPWFLVDGVSVTAA